MSRGTFRNWNTNYYPGKFGCTTTKQVRHLPDAAPEKCIFHFSYLGSNQMPSQWRTELQGDRRGSGRAGNTNVVSVAILARGVTPGGTPQGAGWAGHPRRRCVRFVRATQGSAVREGWGSAFERWGTMGRASFSGQPAGWKTPNSFREPLWERVLQRGTLWGSLGVPASSNPSAHTPTSTLFRNTQLRQSDNSKSFGFHRNR